MHTLCYNLQNYHRLQQLPKDVFLIRNFEEITTNKCIYYPTNNAPSDINIHPSIRIIFPFLQNEICKNIYSTSRVYRTGIMCVTERKGRKEKLAIFECGKLISVTKARCTWSLDVLSVLIMLIMLIVLIMLIMIVLLIMRSCSSFLQLITNVHIFSSASLSGLVSSLLIISGSCLVQICWDRTSVLLEWSHY